MEPSPVGENVEMNKQEILAWCEKYDKGKYNNGLETELHDKTRAREELTRDELIQIVEWKFQDMPGRRKKVIDLMKPVNDDDVRRASHYSFHEQDDRKRVNYLREIPGVGISLASCILTFYDPSLYGIFDIHVWREIFSSKEPKGLFSNVKHYIELLYALRKMATEYGLNVRDVEKALFQKNYDESKLEPRRRIQLGQA